MRRSAQYCLIRHERFPAQQDRVLDAALACIARVGLGKTTLDDVAREAGCARATVYRCFPGKQDLSRAVLEREVDALGTRAIAGRRRTESLADAIVAVILAGADTFHSARRAPFRRRRTSRRSSLPQLSFERGSAVLRGAAVVDRAGVRRASSTPTAPSGSASGSPASRLSYLLQPVRARAARRPRAGPRVRRRLRAARRDRNP